MKFPNWHDGPEIDNLRRRTLIIGIVHMNGLLPRRVIWRWGKTAACPSA